MLAHDLEVSYVPVVLDSPVRRCLTNRDELLGVLGDDPRRIGKVFARHAYGMRRWVDLFSVARAADRRSRTPSSCWPRSSPPTPAT